MHSTVMLAPPPASAMSTPSTPDASLYGYQPSLAANAFFLAVASLGILGTLAVSVYTRRCLTFSCLLAAACSLEIVNYAERVIGFSSPPDLTHFVISVVFSTLAPVFLTMGISVSLTDVTRVLGPHHFPIDPRVYIRLFIPADFLTGVVQGVGLAIIFADSTPASSPDLGSLAGVGRWVVVAGMALQTATLAASLTFLALTYVSAFRRTATRTTTRGARQHYQQQQQQQQPSPLLLSRRATVFMVVLPLSGLCVLLRCVYSLFFFAGGLGGAVARNEMLYIIGDGMLLSEAIITLAVFHPALWLLHPAASRAGEDRERLMPGKRVSSNASLSDAEEAREKTSLHSGGGGGRGRGDRSAEEVGLMSPLGSNPMVVISRAPDGIGRSLLEAQQEGQSRVSGDGFSFVSEVLSDDADRVSVLTGTSRTPPPPISGGSSVRTARRPAADSDAVSLMSEHFEDEPLGRYSWEAGREEDISLSRGVH